MKKIFLLFWLPLLFSASLFSCKDNGETTPPGTAFFLINASPDAPNIDVFTNGTASATNMAFGQDTGYFLSSPSVYNLKIAQTGTTNYLIDANLTFKAGIYYSVFAIDSVSKIKAAVAEDVLFVPAADSARVRFFQFSPNTPYLSAKFKNTVTGDSLFYSGRTFNDQSNNSTLAGFKQIKSGTYNLSITLLPDTIVYKTFTGIQFLSGKNYTVYLKGFNGATSIQQLSLGVVEHNK